MISVLICTHNPRPDFLARTLRALAGQTLPRAEWELLLIDNASTAPVRAAFDVSWHPQGRHLHEATLGKTHALLAGWRASRGALLVTVDDDNLLGPDYLETVAALNRAWPMLGAWGGQVLGEYEMPPADWLRPWLHYLAVRPLAHDLWARLPGIHEALPFGAGLCVRRPVLENYAAQLQRDPRRASLDPIGEKLQRAGDLDLALTAHDLGLGTGLFAALCLTHLIPASRLQLASVAALVEGAEYCRVLLESFRGLRPQPMTPFNRLLFWLRTLRMHPAQRRLSQAGQRGRLTALKELGPWL